MNTIRRTKAPSVSRSCCDWIQIVCIAVTADHSVTEGRRCRSARPWNPPSPWVEFATTDADWDAADPHLLTSDAQPAGARSGPSRSSSSSWPATGSSTARRTPASARRAARSARSSASPASRHRQRVAPRTPPVPGQGARTTSHPKGIDPHRADLRRRAGGRAAHPGRDLRARPRLLPRPRRLDAPAVEGGRRDRHQRHRRRGRAAGGRVRRGRTARPAPTRSR